jgi:hypothetical protein
MATTMLLYAQRRWPDAIDKALWPNAIRHANNICNNVPLRGSNESPMERFAGMKISPQLRHFYHFGSPAYVLNNELQQGQKAKKWIQKARIWNLSWAINATCQNNHANSQPPIKKCLPTVSLSSG